jgi:hypothetical protein
VTPAHRSARRGLGGAGISRHSSQIGSSMVLLPPSVRPLRALHRLTAAAAWALVGATVAASEAERPPLLALRQGAELSCQPALPYFCENVHVRCVGLTTVAASPFKLRVAAGSPTVALVIDDENQARYQDAEVEWAEDGSYLLLSPRSANGYVKLLADGKYIFRHYIQGRGVMSLGHCK